MRGLLVIAALAACADDAGGPDPADQVAGLNAQLRQLTLLANRYEMSMATANDSTCIATHRTYNRSVREIVVRMALGDGDLDLLIAGHGGEAFADVTCAVDALIAELDYHEAVACQDATVELDRAEATRHLAATAAIRDHLAARAAEIEAGVATGAPTWSWSAPSACP